MARHCPGHRCGGPGGRPLSQAFCQTPIRPFSRLYRHLPEPDRPAGAAEPEEVRKRAVRTAEPECRALGLPIYDRPDHSRTRCGRAPCLHTSRSFPGCRRTRLSRAWPAMNRRTPHCPALTSGKAGRRFLAPGTMRSTGARNITCIYGEILLQMRRPDGCISPGRVTRDSRLSQSQTLAGREFFLVGGYWRFRRNRQ